MNKMKEYAAMRKAQLKAYIAQNEMVPSLLIIQIGNNEASTRYVRNKMKDCEEVGITAHHFIGMEDMTTEELIDFINDYQWKYDAVIVQQPLPAHIDQNRINAAIFPDKDVDGFHPTSHFYPATAKGIVDYLKWREVPLAGLNATIIGRSDIVGKPLAKMLTDENCTVTLCHSYTKNIITHCRNSDLIISAVGQPKFLECNNFTDKLIVDVGINFDENGKMCGDCFFSGGITGTANVSPVPGGVGLLTRVALLENVVEAAQ
jgi:methylenetetrahydrofolate dehydrogenase (NADP+)/methenyltetrahydrofolate cyclohydrolase